MKIQGKVLYNKEIQKDSPAGIFFGWIGFNAEYGCYYLGKFILLSYLTIQRNLKLYQTPNILKKTTQLAEKHLIVVEQSILAHSEMYERMKKQELTIG